MPTYVTIQFIKNVMRSATLHKRGRTTIQFKIVHEEGETLTCGIARASEFVRSGHAKYV